MMWCYGVAYLDKNKKGFTDTEPWVLETVGLNHCISSSIDLLMQGFPKAIPFEYDKENIESVTWDYVMDHVVTK